MTAPLKKPNCDQQRADVPTCQPWLHIDYRCPGCGEEWSDEWSSAVDAECPNCGTEIEALDWHELAPCACDAMPKTTLVFGHGLMRITEE